MAKHSEKVRREIKDALEVAYLKLQYASNEMDLMDGREAEKIAKVRKQVLALLQEM